jgi:hypothetical protein
MAAAWTRQPAGVVMAEAAYRAPGGSWEPAVTLEPGKTGIDPAVAVGPSGEAVVVWSAVGVIQAASHPATGSWSAPEPISAPGISLTKVRVAMDGNGNAVAVWVRLDAGAAAIEASSRPAGGTWTSPVTLSTGAATDLDLAVNGTGLAALVWQVGSFVSNSIIYATTMAGGTWSAPVVIGPAAYRVNGPRVGIAANGHVTALWRRNTAVVYADRPTGGSWGAVKTMTETSVLADVPELAVAPNGDAMAAWITSVFGPNGYTYRIRTSVRPAGARWGSSAFLTSKKEHDSGLVAGTTPGNTFVLTWENLNPGLARSATRTVSTPWTAPVTIAGCWGHDLAVGPGVALAVWVGGSMAVQASTAPISP